MSSQQQQNGENAADGEPHVLYDTARDKVSPKAYPSQAIARGVCRNLYDDGKIDEIDIIPLDEVEDDRKPTKMATADDGEEQILSKATNGKIGATDSKADESDENEAEEQHEPQQAEVLEVQEAGAEGDTVDSEPQTPPEELSHNPIAFLKDVNDDFVNRIKGKPAISKQGFRFIQREFGITTESEVVEVLDDPVGCIVWAKASLPDGHSAEAHGEGYRFESDLRDNEFVRYADTRAKNRALSDLTSAGALAVSELQGEK